MTRKKQKNKNKTNRCGGIEWFLMYFDGQHFFGEAIFFQIYLFLLWLDIHFKLRVITIPPLPIIYDGGWGGWSAWSARSVTCGPGTSIRSRKCDNLAPSSGGQHLNWSEHIILPRYFP